MSKKKFVISMPMEDDKTRSKALKVIVGFRGVLSAGIKDADKGEIVAEGKDGVDIVKMTTSLRKKLRVYADIIAVDQVGEKGKNSVEETVKNSGNESGMITAASDCPCSSYQHLQFTYGDPCDVVYYHAPYDSKSIFSIM